jgi:hypothetical protein
VSWRVGCPPPSNVELDKIENVKDPFKVQMK